MENAQTREEILVSALEAREQEVMHYQINIDNYTIALGEISKLSVEEKAELSGFADQLRTSLASEKLEQKKAKIMLAVIQKQVNA
jgi:hypothetical protein